MWASIGHLCGLRTGNLFSNRIYIVEIASWTCTMSNTAAFHVVALFGEQQFCIGLPIVPWEVSQSLDPGRLNSMPVKLPRSLLLILVLSEPSLQEWSCSSLLNVCNWYRGNSFGSTQLLICSFHRSSVPPSSLTWGDKWYWDSIWRGTIGWADTSCAVCGCAE